MSSVRLLLPLPPTCSAERQTATTRLSDCLAADAQQYLQDAIDFLREHFPIHSTHPDCFFLSTLHLPDAPLSALLSGVEATLSNDFHELAEFRPHAPPVIVNPTEAPQLAAAQFYKEVQRLSLLREPLDAALELSQFGLCAPVSISPQQKRLESLLAQSMKDKKRHEALAMSSCVASVCASARNDSVVLNVGEGKGYVSRLLAWCYSKQVIGIDCNKQHKEAAMEKRESELLHCVDEEALYVPRAELCSVTCRVGSTTDWEQTLRGHVPLATCSDRALEGACVAVAGADALQLVAEKVKCRTTQKVIHEDMRHMIAHCRNCVGKEALEKAVSTLSEHDLRKYLIESHFDPVCIDARIPRGVVFTEKGGAEEDVYTVVGYDEASKKYQLRRKRDRVKVLVDANECNLIVKGTHPKWQFLAPVAPTFTPVYSDLRNVVVMGLHACGNLGSNICRIFGGTECKDKLCAKPAAMVLVSCCWHALTYPEGCPLSSTLKNTNFCLNEFSLMLATQPFEAWLCTIPVDSLRFSFHRALCFVLFADQRQRFLTPDFLRKFSGQKRPRSFADFAVAVRDEYFRNSQMYSDTEALRAKADVIENSMTPMYFKRFVAFIMLRMSLSPVIEGVLLMDRTLSVHESLVAEAGGCGSPDRSAYVALLPLFDPRVSPRMFAIIARREQPAVS